MNTYSKQFFTMGFSALLTLSGATSASAQDDYSQPQRELNIMSSIFEAVLEPDSGERRFGRNNGPEALYLAGQGMVFTFDLPPERDTIFFDRERVEALSMRAGTEDGFAFGPDAEIAIAPSFGRWQSVSESSEEQVQLRESMQEKQAQLRELQNQMRELAREQRNNPEGSTEEMEQLQQRMHTLNAELQAQSNTYAQQVREAREARREERNAEKREQATLLISTLCDYGKTLDSLGPDQHISLVLRDFVDGRDQVYVFDQEAIADCSDAESLRQSAIDYQM